MRIELDKLAGHGGKFAHVYGIDELALNDSEVRLIGPGEVTGRIRRAGREVELQGELRAKLEAVCGRCLQPVELPISTAFTERFVQAVGWGSEEQHELSPEDLNVAVFDGEAIDLDDLVREELLLAMPANVLCRENCLGLCPVCGNDRNMRECQCGDQEVDSRWQKLKELQM
jgi:uncharacterized protein